MYKKFFSQKLVKCYIVLIPFKALFSVASAFIIASVIDSILNGWNEKLWYQILIFLIYIIMDYVLNVIEIRLKFRMIERFTIELRKNIFSKILSLEYHDYKKKSTGMYLSTIESDIDTIRETVFFIIDTASELVTMLAALAVIFFFSWQIGIFLLIATGIQSYIPKLFDSKLASVGKDYSLAKEKYMEKLKDGISGYLTGKIFHIEKRMLMLYEDVLRVSERKWSNREYTESFVSLSSYVFNKIAYVGVFCVGGFLASRGLITIAAIIAITDIVAYVSAPALYLVDDIAKFKVASVPLEKIQDILNLPEERKGHEGYIENIDDIRIEMLTFRYETRIVLNQFSFRFYKGKKDIIMGASGGGKATLLRILAGIEKQYEGEIFLGETAFRNLNRQALTEHICYIEQEPFMFNDTIYNNVTLYEKIDESVVMNILLQVGLEKLLGELPEGIHTILSENATRISGGEKQRIAIARAILRKASYILLDESTSHLDTDTALDIEKMLFGLKDIAVILVTHNLSDFAMQEADSIVKM
jgi:ABC-type bacteriocin/lantibiotic exporter with double-glycine peptidase domain